MPRARVLLWLGLLLSALLLAACWLTAPPARSAVTTARLLPSFFAGLPVEPEAWGRAEPVVSIESLESSGGPASLHIYRPPSGRHPALVLSLGVNPAPPDDPRVVRLMSGLARSGLVAVLVQSTALDNDLITAEAPDLIVRAFERTAARSDVRGDHVGLVGFSVGSGLVSVAAADPRIRDRVALVEAFGGYYNVEDLVAAVTTATIRDGDRLLAWEPDALSISVVRTNLLASLPDTAERELVLVALDRDPSAVARLSPRAQIVFDVLANTNPARAAELYARLPASLRDGFAAVSPATHAADIRAPFYLMHDRGDPLIPYVESRRFRAALVAEGRRPYASEFDIFEHVDPTRGGKPLVVARDMVKLFMHIRALLARLE